MPVPNSAPTPASTPSLPSPAELNTRDLSVVLSESDAKRAFVAPMFEHIAPRYDEFTRFFSFGMDARWKRTLLTWATERPVSRAVDIACGTGDLAIALARALPSCQVQGVDVAHRMLALAQARAGHAGVAATFVHGDLAETKLPSESIDLVTAGYAYRNANDLDAALAESARIIRGGGRLFVLDFYRPTLSWWRVCFLAYLRAAGFVVGWWWHRSPILYTYIAASIRHHVTAEEFSARLVRAGFRVARERRYLLGGIAIHEAVRQ